MRIVSRSTARQGTPARTVATGGRNRRGTRPGAAGALRLRIDLCLAPVDDADPLGHRSDAALPSVAVLAAPEPMATPAVGDAQRERIPA